jgi:hypothetical protein
MAPRPTPKLARIRKAWQDGLRSLPSLDGKRHRIGDEIKPLPSGMNEQFDTTDDREVEIARVLRDDALAKRIVKLQSTIYPYGTVPELIMVDFLMKKGERYKFQAQLYGGWRSAGLVPDFVVSRAGTAHALLINGNYWHNLPGKRTKDASDKLRLLNSYYDGEVIKSATIVWESQIMQPNPARDNVLGDAIAGIERGP